jgi:predicted deacetylase
VISGDIDSFAPGGPLPWVSPQLAAFPDHPVRVFDDAVGGVVPPNKTFVASILIRDSRKICTAVLDMMIMRTKSAAASPAQYDKLYVGTAPFDANHPDTFVLLQPWLNTTLNVKTVTLPASVANVAYLNSLVGAARKIDVALMDNTSVDYVKLTLTVFQ